MTQPWTIEVHIAHLTALHGWKVRIVPCNLTGSDHPAYDILHRGRRLHVSTLRGAVTLALATHESHQARYHRAGKGDTDRQPPLIHDELGVRALPRWPRISEHRWWTAIDRAGLQASTPPVRRNPPHHEPVYRDVPKLPPIVAAMLANARHRGGTLPPKPGA